MDGADNGAEVIIDDLGEGNPLPDEHLNEASEMFGKDPDAKEEADKSTDAADSDGETKATEGSDDESQASDADDGDTEDKSDDADDGDGDDQADGGDEDKPGDSDPSRSQLRRQQRRREVEEASARADAAETKARELEAEVASLKAANKADADTPPKEEDFEDHDEFIVALSTHTAKQAIRQEEAERRETEVQTQRETVAADKAERFKASIAEAQGKFKDYDEVALSDKVAVSEHMMSALVESDKGPELLYWLGSNLDEAKRLSQLDLPNAARELGRIEARLESPIPKTVTNAPPPPKTIKGGGTPKKSLSEMSMSEYRKARGF